MKHLDIISVENIQQIAQPLFEKPLSLDTPALNFFTDFTQVKPLVIQSDYTAIETKNLMIKTHVRLKMVLNPKSEFIGLVSADELTDRKIMQKVADGEKREEISVVDCMIPRVKLPALNYKQISSCCIGDVIRTLKDIGRQHCLVVDSEKNIIRGIFSVSDISRKLHIPIDIQDAPSFSKLALTFD